jgi:hypothetical protein
MENYDGAGEFDRPIQANIGAFRGLEAASQKSSDIAAPSILKSDLMTEIP